MIKTNAFEEMSANEMQKLDGGMIILPAAAVAAAVTTVALAIYKSYKNK